MILVSGKTKEYLFSPSESAGDIAQFVFDNWPPEWEEESVSDALECGKLILVSPSSFLILDVRSKTTYCR